jgi:hypothetical protein
VPAGASPRDAGKRDLPGHATGGLAEYVVAGIVAQVITLIDSTALRLRHLPNGEDDEEQNPGRMARASITHNTHKIEA